MAAISILPADTYIVFNKTMLHDYDRRLLSMLYQPIIGADAVNLYFTLWSYLEKNDLVSSEWTHHHLMASMHISLENIIEAREKIEAIGLLKTFYKEGAVNSYVYELYSPLSANDFFKDPILGLSLKQNVGATEFKKTLEYFTVPTPKHKGYKDITNTFTDIFRITMDSNYDVLEAQIKRRNTNSLVLKSKIKINDVISLIPEELFNPRSLTNDGRDTLHRIAFAYNLNAEQLREIIKNSVNERKMINYDLLKDNAANYFKFEHKGKLPTLAYTKNPEFLNKKTRDLSNQEKMIYTFESTSPYDFLASKSSNGKVTNTDKAILSFLLVDLKLNPGVVNVLIDYVLRINNNKLNKKFVETIASQWLKSKIKTAEDALEIAKKEYTARSNAKTKYTKKTKHVEKTPDWYKKDIKTEETDNDISDLLSEYK